jgi:adenine-specific DNA-methyltransferase
VKNHDMKMPPGEQLPPASAPVRDQARFLRRTASDAERRLWSRPRSHGLGVKFRRQHPIGPYIVDFFCREAGLVIEVDPGPASRGGVGRGRAELEHARSLEELGLRVVRLSSDDVMTSLDSVLERISELLG